MFIIYYLLSHTSNKLSYYAHDQLTNATSILFNKFDMKPALLTNADVYIPHSYTDIEQEYYYNIPDNIKIIFAISGCDNFVSKSGLWKLLRKQYDIKDATKLSPMTYIIGDPTEFDKISNIESKFVIKKNIQRQEGIKIIGSITRNDFVNKFHQEGYVVLQEFLDDPLLINKRKVNIRVYVLIIVKKGILGLSKTAYVYDNGFIYYSKEFYNPNSITFDNSITTGYIDRKVYETNPLTIKEFYNYKILMGNVIQLLRKVMKAINIAIATTKFKGDINAQLFGFDIQPDNNFNVKLIEINKGPSLQEMDENDSQLKFNLQSDMYSLVGIIPKNKTNGFIKL